MSPVEYNQDKITIGPNQYLPVLEFENITVNYSALFATLKVESRRSVFPSGLPVRIGDFDNQLGRVHFKDEYNFTNTDPAPTGLRQSRLHLYIIKQ